MSAEMKRVILNRKNSLFVGNPRGGRTAAILARLNSPCRRHEIAPQIYLTQLLTNLPLASNSDLSVWLPNHWKAAQKNTADRPAKLSQQMLCSPSDDHCLFELELS